MDPRTSDRPILRLPDSTLSRRRTGSQNRAPRPRGPGRTHQKTRFQHTFDRLSRALQSDDPTSVLRQDPGGIAPERALVFVTAGRIQNFARAARTIGLEVLAESDLDGTVDFPEQFTLPKGASTLPRTLYCTMPTLESYQQILSLWNAYQKRAKRPDRAAPWWSMFDLLLELRPWGSEDRLVEDARRVITDRLPLDDDQEVPVEFEIWPAVSGSRRSAWRTETESRIIARGGQILDRSSISQPGFIYEAILAGLPAGAVRHMLDSPEDLDGLVTIQGVQFILPWTTGQTDRAIPEPRGTVSRLTSGFSVDAPIRAVLLDGTPVAAHPALVGGVAIEDIHDLVRLSEVRHRTHATSMASLILRGDLEVDGTGLQDTRLLCVPLLVDVKDGAWGPKQRLFVNMVHTALSRLVRSDSPTAPDLFVCNLSVGIKDLRFAGRVSALARLLDWFAAKEGVLFVVSSGNVTDLPPIGKYAQAIESADGDDRRLAVHSYMSDSAYGRTLLSPAEALNALTVGALSTNSKDLQVPRRTGIVTLERGTESLPQITSAVGLGPQRAVKPDILNLGGQQELSFVPAGGDIVARPLEESQRTGILGAAPAPDGAGDGRARHRGTSVAAALTTRAVLQAAEALTRDDGPYAGQELPRRHLALMTRALAVNSARWPEEALDVLEFQLARFGNNQHSRAKAEVCRFFGYGAINPDLMVQAPDHGATLVDWIRHSREEPS